MGPGIIDQSVNGAEAFGALRDGPRHGVGVGDIHGNPVGTLEWFCRPAQRRFGSRHQHDVGARRVKGLGGCFADAGRSAGDEDGLVLKVDGGHGVNRSCGQLRCEGVCHAGRWIGKPGE